MLGDNGVWTLGQEIIRDLLIMPQLNRLLSQIHQFIYSIISVTMGTVSP